MTNVRELCWLTTTKCNQKCKYCHRFVKKKNLNSDEYIKVLNKLIDYGVNKLTFGGGEAMLVDNFTEIVNLAYDRGIKLKLVTNGILLLKKEYSSILDKFSTITLSIDSISNNTNELLGRGIEHFKTIKNVLDMFQERDTKVEIVINSVATNVNLNDFYDLARFIEGYRVSHWRIFRFCPLRESSVLNRDFFEISEEDFNNLHNQVQQYKLPFTVDYRNYDEMETKYLLITPDGQLCISNNLRDEMVGSMIEDDLRKYFVNSEE